MSDVLSTKDKTAGDKNRAVSVAILKIIGWHEILEIDDIQNFSTMELIQKLFEGEDSLIDIEFAANKLSDSALRVFETNEFENHVRKSKFIEMHERGFQDRNLARTSLLDMMNPCLSSIKMLEYGLAPCVIVSTKRLRLKIVRPEEFADQNSLIIKAQKMFNIYNEDQKIARRGFTQPSTEEKELRLLEEDEFKNEMIQSMEKHHRKMDKIASIYRKRIE
jgi:hypothetical protein